MRKIAINLETEKRNASRSLPVIIILISQPLIATNLYHMKQRKPNFFAIFAPNLVPVTGTEKQNNLQKITTDYRSGN